MTTTQNPTPIFDLDRYHLYVIDPGTDSAPKPVLGARFPRTFSREGADAYVAEKGLDDRTVAYVRPEQTVDGITLKESWSSANLRPSYKIVAKSGKSVYSADVFDIFGADAGSAWGVNWSGCGTRSVEDARLYARMIAAAAEIASALNEREARP